MNVSIRNFCYLILGVLFFTSCEDDLSKVKEIEMKQNDVEVTKGAEFIYSDSAHVKAKLKTPILYNHKTAEKPYMEMPKGIEVIFFDKDLKQTSKVTSDYAIRRESEKIVELRKNVVATNAEGKTFKSEELIWDENLKRFYSNKIVTINTGTDIISGPNFWSNEDFSYYEINQGTADFQLKGNPNQ